MKLVNIYTYSTARSPKAAKSQCEAVAFIIEYQDKPERATPQMKIIQGVLFEKEKENADGNT